MIITLPRGLNIDIDNVPENLEELVAETFAAYTEGTNSDYTYQDKLCFIDIMARRLHHADSEDAIHDEIKRRFEYELDECGNIMDEEDFYTFEFMEQVYERALEDSSLYSNEFAETRRDNETIMKIIMRVIKTVMDWEPE